jgi:hypothetical protein
MVNLISEQFVKLIEEYSHSIVKRWSVRLMSDPLTSSFTQKNIQYLEEKAVNVLGSIGKWISFESSKDEIGKRYAQEGMDLFKLGVPLCEVYRAFYVGRQVVLQFVENESIFDSALQLHKMRELDNRVTLFFDRAVYYIIRGYMEEMNRKLNEVCDLPVADAEKVFFNKSFYNK